MESPARRFGPAAAATRRRDAIIPPFARTFLAEASLARVLRGRLLPRAGWHSAEPTMRVPAPRLCFQSQTLKKELAEAGRSLRRAKWPR